MKFFIDTADVNEIRDAAAMGVVDGVTTNPSLIAKVGRPLREVIVEICEIVDGPISAEVLATDMEGILKEGRELAKIHDNIVVKVPLIPEGLKAVKKFTSEGIKTNVALQQRIVTDEDFVRGRFSTRFLERYQRKPAKAGKI